MARLLLEHNREVRQELNRFRGREIQTTGDGFLAVFDGPARAVRCARAIGGSSRSGIGRAGFNGEVESWATTYADWVQKPASRGRAAAGEALVSATTSISSRIGVAFGSSGDTKTKGLGEARELSRIADS